MINFIKNLLKINTKRGAMFGIEFRALKKQFGELFLVRMQSVASIETHGASINTKRGAMFSIDARVTLAVTAIAAFIVGINEFTDLDRENKRTVEYDLKVIKSALEDYYEDNYQIPATTSVLVNDGYLDLTNGDLDPWGNPYIIGYQEQSRTILQSKMDVKYVYLLSMGKNSVRDTANVTNLATWESLEVAGDDILIKFDTLAKEKEIAETEDLQLRIIQINLEAAVAQRQADNRTFCSSKFHQSDKRCDINEDDVYDYNEEIFLNYMFREKDETAGIYYDDTFYKSGYLDTTNNAGQNMYSFLTAINTDTSYAKSPRGLALHFTSNKYKNTQAPYQAEIWYDVEQTVY